MNAQSEAAARRRLKRSSPSNEVLRQWASRPPKELAADAWYEDVVKICRGRGFAAWFYSDKSAWIDTHFPSQTPEEAVDENVSACM